MSKPSRNPISVSIGILARNEEASLRATLESLFRQSVFQRLSARRERVEIWCVANGCSDRTAAVAREVFAEMEQRHGYGDAFAAHVVEVPEPGKCNAWNRFVHEFSAPEARCLCLMDADIAFHHLDSLYNLVAALDRRPDVAVSIGRRSQGLLFKERRTIRDRISLAISELTSSGRGRIGGQLYCIRAPLARNLLLPRELNCREEAFIGEVICTQFLNRPRDPNRVLLVREVAHVFQPDLGVRAVMNAQKRRMVGEATAYMILSHLRRLPAFDRRDFAESIRRLEARDPDWARTVLDEHLQATRCFWRLFPGLLSSRCRALLKVPGGRKLALLPVALLEGGGATIAAWRAHRALRQGRVARAPNPARHKVLSTPSVGGK